MNARLLTLLLCAFTFSAHAQTTGVISTVLTAGELVFHQQTILFQTATKAERYPFPEAKTGSDFGATKHLIAPGLVLRKFEVRSAQISGAAKDVSRITLADSDGTLIELVADEPARVVRTDIELTDHQRVTHWRLASLPH